MWFSRLSSAVVVLACVGASSEAAAQQSRVGQQWLTGGLALAPALVVDKTAADVGLPTNVVGGGLRARVGFQHLVSAQFVMAAEVELGNAYFGSSTMSADGRADAGGGLAWQAGLLGRWVPRGDLTGPSFGFGLQTFRASLPETPIQALSGDLRFGWYLWNDKTFVLAELGYAIPFLEGVDAPTSFDGTTTQIADQKWTLHRFVFGFSYGF